MSHSTGDGVTHDASYWKLNFIAIDIPNETLRFTFDAHHSVDAYDADAAPIAEPVKEYVFQGEAYRALMQQNMDFVQMLLTRTLMIAMTTHDTPNAETGELESFFANATGV